MRAAALVLMLFSVVCQAQVTEDSVTFKNGSVTLAGTLTVPDGDGPFPAILLISGSGPQNRDSELFGFKPFKILADHLTANGIAVLRYDDRGTGTSGGTSPMMVTSDTLAADAMAGIRFLENDDRFSNVGALGHSEGGIIAPMLAVKDKALDFIILMAGYGVPGREVITVQQKAIMEAQGLDSAFIQLSGQTNDKVIDLMDSGLPEEKLRDSVNTLIMEMVELMPQSMSAMISDKEAFATSQTNNVMQQFASPWMRFFLYYDPAPELSKVECPVLLLFGGKDKQILVSQNLELMKDILHEAGNNEVQVITYPDANHLFQKAETGSPMEYGRLDKAFVPDFLDDITNWIKMQTNE